MERVHFEQEQMLLELKDFASKGIFSQAEIKQILRKRTSFETVLVRRIPKKSDFLRYAAYEMGLEALRRKRVKRLNIPTTPPSISDYALVRRQFAIFERALKKFKDDVGLWVQYLQVAKREGARALVGRISARAILLHPTSPALYVLGASHELTHHSPSAARTLLQRGLRINPESVDLWREYVKMEMGFAEGLRRRWKVLGLDVGPGVSLEKGDDGEGMQDVGEDEDVDNAYNDEKARKEVLSGGIVKTVITNAVKAVPQNPLFLALRDVIQDYPCPQTVRQSILTHLYVLLHDTLVTRHEPEPQAVKLYATRFLTPELESEGGDELIDALKQANESLVSGVKDSAHNPSSTSEPMAEVYVEFVQEWFEKDIDDNLKLYLLSSLQSLHTTLQSSSPSPTVFAGLLHLYASPRHPHPQPGPAKIFKFARKFTSSHRSSSRAWIARLQYEGTLTATDPNTTSTVDWRSTWADARKALRGDRIDVKDKRAVWMWGIDHLASTSTSASNGSVVDSRFCEDLLRECMAEPDLADVQDRLCLLLIEAGRTQHPESVEGCESFLRGVARRWTPTAGVWARVFDIFLKASTSSSPSSSSSDDSTTKTTSRPTRNTEESKSQQQLLSTIYELWRSSSASPTAAGEAALHYASYLLHTGSGGEAGDVISRARVCITNPGERAKFDGRWAAVLDMQGGDGGLDKDEVESESEDEDKKSATEVRDDELMEE